MGTTARAPDGRLGSSDGQSSDSGDSRCVESFTGLGPLGGSSAVSPTTLADRHWARGGSIAGIVALLAYVALNAVTVPGPAAVVLAFAFGFGLTVASIGVHLGITRNVAPRLGLLAAVANTVAATELVAMLLVQLAVKAADPNYPPAFTSIWLGLDVAWDLFVGAGTVLFGAALWRHPRFRPLIAGAGVIIGALLLMLNIATFPTPPAAAGWFDAGPIVGLWYLVLMVRVLVLRGEHTAHSQPT